MMITNERVKGEEEEEGYDDCPSDAKQVRGLQVWEYC